MRAGQCQALSLGGAGVFKRRMSSIPNDARAAQSAGAKGLGRWDVTSDGKALCVFPPARNGNLSRLLGTVATSSV